MDNPTDTAKELKQTLIDILNDGEWPEIADHYPDGTVKIVYPFDEALAAIEALLSKSQLDLLSRVESELFSTRIFHITSINKAYKKGYNDMVEATKVLLLEQRARLAAIREEVRDERSTRPRL